MIVPHIYTCDLRGIYHVNFERERGGGRGSGETERRGEREIHRESEGER